MKLHHALGFCIALSFTSDLHAVEKDLNILMIIVDDLAPVISSYGGPVSTPAIDQLAEQGVRFKSNFANVPVCGASRASMLSGLAPTATRFLSYDSRLDQDVDSALSLPALFRQHGWHTLANGKVFDVIEDSSESWTEPVWSPDDQWFGKEPDGRGEHLQSAYINPVTGSRSPYFERLDVSDTAYPDGQVAAKTVADLHRLAGSDTPFFLAVGLRKPHLPFNAPERYWHFTGSPKGGLPETWHVPTPNIPTLARHRSPELRAQYDALPLFGDPNDTVASEIVNAYHAAVRFADAQVGHVLEGLATSGAADNTLVVLLGDHGFLLGEQRMWTKHALFEPALQTPLIISHPRMTGGHEATAVTDLLDIFPTLSELAGIEIPSHIDGVSLRSLMEDPNIEARATKKGSIARWMNGESVRDQNYRYTRWFDEQGQTIDEMLFDLTSDPLERTNLAGNSALADVTAGLVEYLNAARSGSVWSTRLGEQYSLWRLASSTTGALLLGAVTYPVPVVLTLLLFIIVVATSLFRYRSRRKAAVTS